MTRPRPSGVRRDGRRASSTKRPTAGQAYARILGVVARIPRGKVATYGQVAARAGYAHAPRLAGYALFAMGPGSPLPWHRVLGAGGRLTLGRLSPEGALEQRRALEAEGVTFDARGRVVLDRHRWGGTRRGTEVGREGPKSDRKRVAGSKRKKAARPGAKPR